MLLKFRQHVTQIVISSTNIQKAFFLCIFALLVSCSLLRLQILTSLIANDYETAVQHITVKRRIYNPRLKYILQWTEPCKELYKFVDKGPYSFLERHTHCPVNKCYVTSNKSYLPSISLYNAILFYSCALSSVYTTLPRNRSLHQRYVFVSADSATDQPYIYHKIFRAMFNLTWTYKLNSDVYYVKNKKGKIIGPKEVMQWPNVIINSGFIDKNLKKKLDTKKIAAAWFVPYCEPCSKRWKYAKQLAKELAEYNEELHIYGDCGTKQCNVSDRTECLRKLETDYYFYLSFEDSISEDYVTEKLLLALQHYTVPVVYGGANYTRFMPDGMYLNAQKLNPANMAKKMVHLIKNRVEYYNYFRWHNYFIYEHAGSSPDTDPYCNFCKKLDDADKKHQVTIYQDITKWWRGRDLSPVLSKVL